jgi:hypothetical protein
MNPSPPDVMTMFGKATDVAKTMLPEQVKRDFSDKWREAGFESESEALRHLIAIYTYGAAHIESLHLQRIRGMARHMAVTGTQMSVPGEHA